MMVVPFIFNLYDCEWLAGAAQLVGCITNWGDLFNVRGSE